MGLDLNTRLLLYVQVSSLRDCSVGYALNIVLSCFVY